MKQIISSGKRKTSIAKAKIQEGRGKFIINNKDYNSLPKLDRFKLQEPIKIAEEILGQANFDVSITVRGGGEKGQIEAARLALAKAIVEFTNNEKLSVAFLNYDRNLLIADVRRKEACKPGDSKARAKRQSSKR